MSSFCTVEQEALGEYRIFFPSFGTISKVQKKKSARFIEKLESNKNSDLDTWKKKDLNLWSTITYQLFAGEKKRYIYTKILA